MNDHQVNAIKKRFQSKDFREVKTASKGSL